MHPAPGDTEGQHIIITACGDDENIHRKTSSGASLSFPEYCRGFDKLIWAKYNRDRTECHDRDTESVQYLKDNPLEYKDSRGCLRTLHG